MAENQAEEMITLKKAERQVELACQRLALLHLAFARTLVDELGEEKGKKIIIKAIKNYGQRIGDKVKNSVVEQGLEPLPENYGAGKARDLPEFGMHQGHERVIVDGENRRRAYGCVMGKLWRECGEGDLGRLYCLVDPAKYLAFNPNYKLVHTRALPDGDDFCELVVRPTTEKERADFADENKDWSYIDKDNE